MYELVRSVKPVGAAVDDVRSRRYSRGVDLVDCLPESLRGPRTTITRIAAGLSGAGVYKVDAGGDPFVRKISTAQEPLGAWHRKVEIQGRDPGVAATTRSPPAPRRA